MQDLLTHLERIGFFEAAHHRQTGEYTADIENGLRVKGLMRGAVVLTTDDQFVALAWYESGNGPVCRLVTAKAPTVTATCLDAEGRVIFETTQEGGRPPLP